MRSRRSSTPKRILRALRSAILVESRQGRAAEIAGWSNAASAVAVAAGAVALAWSRLGSHALWLGLPTGAVALFLLRLALTHRMTVWIAAVLGTLTIAVLGGLLSWVFAHALEMPTVPPIAAAVGALLASLAPAWSYGQLVQRRAESVRDSLIDPVSVP